MQTYSGQCHCGAVRFRFRSDLITKGCRCNCSICSRRGVVMSSEYIEPEQLIQWDGTEYLALYQFGDHQVNHYFCKRCGVYPFHEAVDKPGRYRINLACVEGVDIPKLQIGLIDGKSF